jgi:hypothetical protein
MFAICELSSQSEFLFYQPEFLQHINNPSKIGGNKWAVLGGVQSLSLRRLDNFMLATGYFCFKKNSSVGLNFTETNYGKTYKNTAFNLLYAYQLPLSSTRLYDTDEKYINLGTSIKYNQIVSDYSSLLLYDKVDPNFPLLQQRSNIADYTAGISVRLNWFKFGISSSSLKGLFFEKSGLPYNNVNEFEMGFVFKRKKWLESTYERKESGRTHIVNFKLRTRKTSDVADGITQLEGSWDWMGRRKKAMFGIAIRKDYWFKSGSNSFNSATVHLSFLFHKNDEKITTQDANESWHIILSTGYQAGNAPNNSANVFGGVQKAYKQEKIDRLKENNGKVKENLGDYFANYKKKRDERIESRRLKRRVAKYLKEDEEKKRRTKVYENGEYMCNFDEGKNEFFNFQTSKKYFYFALDVFEDSERRKFYGTLKMVDGTYWIYKNYKEGDVLINEKEKKYAEENPLVKKENLIPIEMEYPEGEYKLVKETNVIYLDDKFAGVLESKQSIVDLEGKLIYSINENKVYKDNLYFGYLSSNKIIKDDRLQILDENNAFFGYWDMKKTIFDSGELPKYSVIKGFVYENDVKIGKIDRERGLFIRDAEVKIGDSKIEGNIKFDFADNSSSAIKLETEYQNLPPGDLPNGDFSGKHCVYMVKWALDEKLKSKINKFEIIYEVLGENQVVIKTFSHTVELKGNELIFKNGWSDNIEYCKKPFEGSLYDWVYLKPDGNSYYSITIKGYPIKGKMVETSKKQIFYPNTSGNEKCTDEK